MSTDKALRLLFLCGAGCICGCTGQQAMNAPPSAPSGVTGAPQGKHWVQESTDAVWNEVASPINGLIPKPRAKPVIEEAEPSEPPEVIVIRKGARSGDAEK